MPQKILGIKYKKEFPIKEDRKGGIVESQRKRFETVENGLHYVLLIEGPMDVMNEEFKSWPLDVGGNVEMKISTSLSKQTLDSLLAKKEIDDAATKKANKGKGKQKTLDDEENEDDEDEDDEDEDDETA